MSFNKIYDVPIYDMPSYAPKTKRQKKQVPVQDPFAWSHEDIEIKTRMNKLLKQIQKLIKERLELSLALKKRELLRNQNRLREVKLYVLKLEDDCWYIGMSYNPDKRFIQHSKGKGAKWTSVHPPIKIIEIKATGKYIQDQAARLEDDLTLEYALKYGSAYVRGGGFCQAKPIWPSMVVENEIKLL